MAGATSAWVDPAHRTCPKGCLGKLSASLPWVDWIPFSDPSQPQNSQSFPAFQSPAPSVTTVCFSRLEHRGLQRGLVDTLHFTPREGDTRQVLSLAQDPRTADPPAASQLGAHPMSSCKREPTANTHTASFNPQVLFLFLAKENQCKALQKHIK